MGDLPEPNKTLDTIGLYCPQPLFMTREEIDTIEVGEVLEVLSDDPAAEEDLKSFAKRTGHELMKIEKNGDVLRFLLRRTK
jgi:TusA-related sulfurtransferase